MRQVIADKDLQEQFEKDGFIIIPHFLNTGEIKELRDFYFSQPSDLKQGFHATLHSQLTDYRQKVSDKIAETFTPKATGILKDYRPVFANYTVKEPDGNSGFDLHLDWSMVDEKQFSSITTWVPLQDITEQNGHLWVLKGSHQFEYTIRGGPGLRLHCARPFEEVSHQKFEKLTLQLKAGTALIYDHRLFHGSPPNETQETRIAINYTMIPQEAKSIHYQFRSDEEVEALEVPNSFYNNHILNTEPIGGKSLGFKKVPPIFLTQSQVNSLFFDNGNIISK